MHPVGSRLIEFALRRSNLLEPDERVVSGMVCRVIGVREATTVLPAGWPPAPDLPAAGLIKVVLTTRKLVVNAYKQVFSVSLGSVVRNASRELRAIDEH